MRRGNVVAAAVLVRRPGDANLHDWQVPVVRQTPRSSWQWPIGILSGSLQSMPYGNGGQMRVNLIYLRLREWVCRWSHQGILVWPAVIGVLGGLSSAAFREASIGFEWLLTGRTGDLVHVAESLPPEHRLWVPAAGGVIAGVTLMLSDKLLRGRRSRDYLEAVAIGDGRIRFWPTVAQLFSSLCSIGSGTSIGREGGMVQQSALLASLCGRWLQCSPQRLRLLVACGGAAGIASAYNTPLAGALFIAEIVLQSLAIEILGPLVIASVAATLTIRQWIGLRPLFETPDLPPLPTAALFSVLLLGLAAGVLGPVFLWLVDGSRRLFRSLTWPIPVSLGLGGLIVGVISVYEPDVWGNGHAVVSHLLEDPPAWRIVLALLTLKALATAIAVGSGAVGGIFTPTLVLGTALGSLWGDGLPAWFPGTGVPSATYGVIGMSALLAATTHAPVMAVIMVFEMTLDADLLLPLIVASLPARYMSVALHARPVYQPSLGNPSSRHPWLMQVRELRRVPSLVIGPDDPLAASGRSSESGVGRIAWLVDRDGRFTGGKVFDAGASASSSEGRSGKDPVGDWPVLGLDDGISAAVTAFLNVPVDVLPIVDRLGVLVGEISRADVVRALEPPDRGKHDRAGVVWSSAVGRGGSDPR